VCIGYCVSDECTFICAARLGIIENVKAMKYQFTAAFSSIQYISLAITYFIKPGMLRITLVRSEGDRIYLSLSVESSMWMVYCNWRDNIG
jgi:hypothetical protein